MAKGAILIIDDDHAFAETIRRMLTLDGYSCAVASDQEEALGTLTADPTLFDLALLDMRLGDSDGLELLPKLIALRPDFPVILSTAFGTVQNAVDAMRLGAFDFLTKPFPRERLLSTIERALERFRLVRENELLKSQLKTERGRRTLQTASPAFSMVLEMARRVAPTDATVLLTGETGTGKEGVAQLIYELSQRNRRSFVRVNCAALAENLLEAQLFGYTKGAFTGADESRIGLFEEASGGTLFLDEIGDISASLQTKLLRVIQEGEFMPVGETRSRTTNVRIIAATNRDLKAAVAQGHFRDDLYYRLNVFSLHLPSLKDRLEDLPILTRTFVDESNRRAGKPVKGLNREAEERCRSYSWPGNVRELKNMIERAVILCQGEWIGPELLGLSAAGPSLGPRVGEELKPLWQVEKEYISTVLKRMGWAKSGAARTLGISRKTLDRKIREFDLAENEKP